MSNSTTLHYVIGNKDCSACKVETIISSNPDAVKAKDKHGFLPLHIACCHGWSNEKLSEQERSERVSVVSLLMQCYPEGAKERTFVSGNTPLLLALQYDAPDEVVESVLKMCPDAAKICNNEGLSPLELTCFPDPPKRSSSITSIILDNLPNAVHINEESAAKSVLERALWFNNNKEVLMTLLTSVSKENLKVAAETSLLKQAIHHKAGKKVILALLDVVSEEYLKAERVDLLYLALDFDGGTWACFEDAVDPASVLLDRFPKEVLLEMNPDTSKTNLHKLFEHWDIMRWSKSIIESVVSVSSCHDKLGRTPLHISMDKKTMPCHLILLLIRSYPYAFLEKGGNPPQTPLEMIRGKRSKNRLLYAIKIILTPLCFERKVMDLPSDKKLALRNIFLCSKKTSVLLPDDIWKNKIIPFLCEVDLVPLPGPTYDTKITFHLKEILTQYNR